MTWSDLLFMHWRVPEEALRRLVPAALEIDRFQGEAWLGVIPFYMTDVRPRWTPPVLASRFLELNVRTYVRHNGRAGVWFFSLDAASRLGVWAGQRFFCLPYQFAEMSQISRGDLIVYKSRRAAAPDVQLECEYKPRGPQYHASPGSLDSWLTERYCLFAASSSGQLFRGDIEHAPWPLQAAEAEVEINTMTGPLGIALRSEAPLLHFARRLDVRAWALTRSGSSGVAQ
jgi:uncharacterized protein YqjF (DUF2071 family)